MEAWESGYRCVAQGQAVLLADGGGIGLGTVGHKQQWQGQVAGAPPHTQHAYPVPPTPHTHTSRHVALETLPSAGAAGQAAMHIEKAHLGKSSLLGLSR